MKINLSYVTFLVAILTLTLISFTLIFSQIALIK